MSEMSDMHKLIMVLELAKTARVGMELTYFDVIELLGELESLKDYIAELEKDNNEFRQLIRDWSIVLDQNCDFQLWQVESVRQAMLEINKESELREYIDELEAESERFTAHSDIERQDDKWIPEVIQCVTFLVL